MTKGQHWAQMRRIDNRVNTALEKVEKIYKDVRQLEHEDKVLFLTDEEYDLLSKAMHSLWCLAVSLKEKNKRRTEGSSNGNV